MEERRKFDRRLLTYFSRVIDRKSGKFLGYLVDLTPGGAMVIGNYPIDVNAQLELQIDLPERYNNRENLNIQAKAIWCLQDSDPELYRTGLELIKVNPEHLEMLNKIISDYGFTKKS